MASFAAYTDGSDVIQRSLGVEQSGKTELTSLEDIFEISRSVDWIKSNNYTRVALQFPDELLVDSAAVATSIQSQCSAQVFILSDTSYGSCCVDEVAAEHNNADCLIHYGRACLSTTRGLPVLYVFTKLPLDVSACSRSLAKLVNDPKTPIALLYDVRYQHGAQQVAAKLQDTFPHLILPELEIYDKREGDNVDNSKDANVICKLGRVFKLESNYSLEDYSVFYIGGESPSLTNWMINLNKSTFHSYNPVSGEARTETLNVNKMLMKRYYMIERAKDAGIIGILAGTLGISDHIKLMDRLKQCIKNAGKKSYTFVVGKLNVAKLANFAEIDAYVLVACPENTLVDSSEFYRPIITPYELEVACNQAREWTGDYFTDFRELLPGSAGHVELSAERSAEVDVSLVTGGVRSIGIEENPESDGAGGELVPRDQVLTVATSGEFLSSRSWQGLEQNLGQTPVTKAVEGTKGIAASYAHENK